MSVLIVDSSSIPGQRVYRTDFVLSNYPDVVMYPTLGGLIEVHKLQIVGANGHLFGKRLTQSKLVQQVWLRPKEFRLFYDPQTDADQTEYLELDQWVAKVLSDVFQLEIEVVGAQTAIAKTPEKTTEDVIKELSRKKEGS